MAPTSAQSSPTLRSPSLYFLPNLPLQDLDLQDAVLSHQMEDGRPREILHTSHDLNSDESAFFDLQPPAPSINDFKTEDIMTRLVSIDHLNLILQDHVFFHRFSAFLNRFNPHLVPTLIRYLEMRKAVKAIEYANAIARRIPWRRWQDLFYFLFPYFSGVIACLYSGGISRAS